jgi:hypothetical protein
MTLKKKMKNARKSAVTTIITIFYHTMRDMKEEK